MTTTPMAMANRQRLHLMWRKTVNVVMLGMTGVLTLLTAGVLLFILGYLAVKGAQSVNWWTFLFNLPQPPGEPGGGVANAIMGSAKMLALAVCIGFPIGFLAGVYLSEYGYGFYPSLIRYVADLLNGVPSIVTGIFVYTLFYLLVKPSEVFSGWAGSVALGVMLAPLVVRSTEDCLRTVPMELREGAMALGAPKWRVIFFVVVPAAASGIFTALMLGFARIAGETAPLLFTATGNLLHWSKMSEPTESLTVLIYNFATGPDPDWHRQAWAAGFLLLLLVLVINLAARLIVPRLGAILRLFARFILRPIGRLLGLAT
ncbi:MAG: phosphate ABC transporter permease PstA [Planctomycetota bacterium]